MWLLGIGAAAAQTALDVRQILGFQLLQGQPQWAPQIQQRLVRTTFVLYPNGQIVIDSPGRSDLYPLSGHYQVQGQIISFWGERRSQTGNTGVAYTVWGGSIDAANNTVRIEVTSGSGNAAVINQMPFQGGSSSRYAAVLLVSPR
jgi:hypothetical protein